MSPAAPPPNPASAQPDPRLLAEFVAEAREHLDQIEPDLLALETGDAAGQTETVNRLFRVVHSIKGAAALLGLAALRDFGHLVENVLLGLRQGRVQATSQNVDVLLQALDRLRQMVETPPAQQSLPGPQDMPQLHALQKQAAPPQLASSPSLAMSPSFPPPARSAQPAPLPPLAEAGRVLIVEDNRLAGRLLAERVQEETGLTPLLAASMAQASQALEEEGGFFAGVLDLNLPDAPDGEVVDLALAKGLPSIILTATFDDQVRQRILAKRVVDYVVKGGSRDLDYVCHLLRRLQKNRHITVLVVDDTRALREAIQGLLEVQGFHVLGAENGLKALEVFDAHPEIRLVITDYNMPEMDGLQLVPRLRDRADKERLAIIAMSAESTGTLSAKFLKSGANDFLPKPFLNEEFNCRVSQNVEILELIQEIKEVSRRDFLTGLYNRRYLWEAGSRLYQEQKDAGQSLALGIFDLDRFKTVNDAHGHAAGDQVLRQVAQLLQQTFPPPALVARCGGEEFCVLLPGLERAEALLKFNQLRKLVERTPVQTSHANFSLTISAGLATSPGASMDEMILHADALLYQAKSRGRNRVQMES